MYRPVVCPRGGSSSLYGTDLDAGTRQLLLLFPRLDDRLGLVLIFQAISSIHQVFREITSERCSMIALKQLGKFRSRLAGWYRRRNISWLRGSRFKWLSIWPTPPRFSAVTRRAISEPQFVYAGLYILVYIAKNRLINRWFFFFIFFCFIVKK